MAILELSWDLPFVWLSELDVVAFPLSFTEKRFQNDHKLRAGMKSPWLLPHLAPQKNYLHSSFCLGVNLLGSFVPVKGVNE